MVRKRNKNPADAPGEAGKIGPALLQIKREILTYRRELPRLLEEGEEGRIALIKGDQVVSLWDTFDDAYQAGRAQFGLEAFIAQPIDSRDLERVFPKELDPPDGHG